LRTELAQEFSEHEMLCIEKHAKDSKTHVNSKLLVALLDAHPRLGSTFTPELPIELAIIEHLSEK
jgi:hypothetical protein